MKLPIRIIKPYITGLHLGSYTYLFSNVLDHTISRSSTLDLIKKNPQLYIDGTVSNFVNLMGLSPVYYVMVDNFLLRDKSIGIQLLKVMGMVFTHNVLFYNLHKLFHEKKGLYFLHRFHHKFIKPIPSNGNSVSINEYNIAYVLPFLVGAIIFNPNGLSFQLSIAIISIFNALVHCPPLKYLKFPPLFVSPNDHLIHHEKLTTKYASPILNMDYISRAINDFFYMNESPEHKKYRHTKYI
jgi:hypothetical protein